MGLLQQAKSLVTGEAMPSKEAWELRNRIVEPIRRLVHGRLDDESAQTRVEWILGMHLAPDGVSPIMRDREALADRAPEPLAGSVSVETVGYDGMQMDRRDVMIGLLVDGEEVPASLRIPRDMKDVSGFMRGIAEGREFELEGRMAVFELEDRSVREFQIDGLKVDGVEVAMGLDARRRQDRQDRMTDISVQSSRTMREFPEGWRVGILKGPTASVQGDRDAAAALAMGARAADRGR